MNSGGVFLGGRVQCPEHAHRLKYFDHQEVVGLERDEWSISCVKSNFILCCTKLRDSLFS